MSVRGYFPFFVLSSTLFFFFFAIVASINYAKFPPVIRFRIQGKILKKYVRGKKKTDSASRKPALLSIKHGRKSRTSVFLYYNYHVARLSQSFGIPKQLFTNTNEFLSFQ